MVLGAVSCCNVRNISLDGELFLLACVQSSCAVRVCKSTGVQIQIEASMVYMFFLCRYYLRLLRIQGRLVGVGRQCNKVDRTGRRININATKLCSLTQSKSNGTFNCARGSAGKYVVW